jgi:ribonuclease G
MTEDILVNITPQETRVAIVQQGAIQELHVERTLSRGRVGNIYLGRVARVLPGMQSAFIDIGLERAAFLHVADIWHPRDGSVGNNAQGVPVIEKLLFEGQALLVQVIKDPIGSKGARLSTQISIAGRSLVFLPQDKHIGVSQKIESEIGRESLKQRVAALLPAQSNGGYIVRTSAEESTDAELARDVAYLRKTWERIKKSASKLPAPSLLHEDLSLVQRVLRDFAGDETNSIQIDSRENALKLMEFASEYTPTIQDRVQHYIGERPIFDLYNIETEIEKALLRRVDLKSGGYLMIDQTEAMTTIDVNTGGFVGARNFDDTIFKTNLEAAQTIARQLRLRNLGGIILIDFIDMENSIHRESVLAELKKSLSKDRTRHTVNTFSPLGLVEMTRKRTRESLAQLLCEPCPACGGKGHVKTAQTLCYDILREIMRESRQFNPREFRILASQSVVDLFLEEESPHLAQLGDFIGKPISLQVEASFHQEQYDIILM